MSSSASRSRTYPTLGSRMSYGKPPWPFSSFTSYTSVSTTGLPSAPNNIASTSLYAVESQETAVDTQTNEKAVPVRRWKLWWARFNGHTRDRVPGVLESLKAFAMSSWLNLFLVFIPFAWVAHFLQWSPTITFGFSFIAVIPLESLFEFGGEQLALYCGQDFGDLIIITLNNTVEATLAVLLLTKCQLKLLQSTIAGVVLLHLLFIPGVSFMTGGVRVWEQDLHPHATQLNHTLLAIGVLSLLVPAAFFAALNPGSAAAAIAAKTTTSGIAPFITDTLRNNILEISRGMSIILLIVYIASRIFIFNPPGDGQSLMTHPDAPEAMRQREELLKETEPEVNPWVCVAVLVVTVAIMAVTAEWLVGSIEPVLAHSHISIEWFGIILLPIISFSGDAIVAIVFFLKTVCWGKPKTPESLAKGRAIDLSIQFIIFWMPFLVLLGWWTGKPLIILFDLYEVSLLIGACFLVNYVTADSKTNWAEGVMLVAFYLMIALVSWFYDGQIEVTELLVCGSVASFSANATVIG